jgi:protein-tyrosine phosphatase
MPYHFDILEPELAISGTPQVVEDILAPGFEAVLNVWNPPQIKYLPDLPMSVEFIWVPMEDGVPMPLALIRRAVLELAVLRQRGLQTLVHCQAGQSRSATVVALYWMARDGVSWEEAFKRMRLARPIVRPHPLLLDADTREIVVQSVREFLAGDETVFLEARAEAQALLDADRERGAEATGTDWCLIENGLACGAAPVRHEELARGGFTRILNTAAPDVRLAGSVLPPGVSAIDFGLPEASEADVRIAAAAVRRLRDWRHEGQRVFVVCNDGKSRSALVTALHIMVDRGWDFAGAMWYIRRRRPGAWPRPQLLAGRPIGDFLRACREE